ncbi:MAG: helix-turn-helix domain-containing protein [Candidatus Aenigmatarchaeota archaeon]
MEERDLAKENLAKKIAGEIVLSPEAGKTIQKWRAIFKIPQRTLAEEMKVMPSVISDYENGRRKSPGIKVIKRIVDSMIDLDEKTGGKVAKEFSIFPAKAALSEAILDLREFRVPVGIKDFCKCLGAIIIGKEGLDGQVHGYTVIDTHKAIVELPPTEMVKLYGLTSERALIFTGTHRGRSSMVALKVTNLKPKAVILHGAGEVDSLAKRIADSEGIPLATIKTGSVEGLLEQLKRDFSGK